MEESRLESHKLLMLTFQRTKDLLTDSEMLPVVPVAPGLRSFPGQHDDVLTAQRHLPEMRETDLLWLSSLI